MRKRRNVSRFKRLINSYKNQIYKALEELSLGIWIKGLASALVSGVSTGILLMIVDPLDFNLSSFTVIRKLISVCVVSGLISVANYLKKSPMPNNIINNDNCEKK